MTIIYEVHTGHTKTVLKGFAKLQGKKTGARLMFRFSMLALILFTLPRALKAPSYGYAICWSFGIFVILIAVFRPYLMYLNYLARDTYYKNNTQISISFGHSQFVVDDGKTTSYKYYEIKNLYADDKLYYIGVGEGDVFVFAKSEFVLGDSRDFYDFMQRSSGKEFEGVNLKFRQRLLKLRQDINKAEEEHDAKLSKSKKKK